MDPTTTRIQMEIRLELYIRAWIDASYALLLLGQ